MANDRVAVFIDNSNIFHNIRKIKQSDKDWVSLYNPLKLSQKLAGKRKLAYVGFYCVRPPSYLLTENEKSKEKYSTATRYYNEVEKLTGVTVKYGDLKGGKGETQEKNLDTQVATDMVAMAALNQFDVAVLISNDGDYKSAIENVKMFSKKVEVLFFKGSLSMSLRQVADVTRRARCSQFELLNNLGQ